MTDSTEHRNRWSDDLAAYALDALDERETREVERHIAECESCTERLRWLQPAVDVLPASVPQRQPSPDLRARLMDAVGAEANVASSKPVRASSTWRERLGFSGWSLRPAFAGLAVLLVIAAGVTGYVLRDGGGDGPATETYAAVGVGEGTLAHGTLAVNGDQGSLSVTDLPATRRGEVYQAWVQDAKELGGEVHPSSVFVVSDNGRGTVLIPRGLEDADRVMVTREPVGGSEKPHESSIITAELD